MSLKSRLSREVPADTARLGQILFSPKNMFRQLGDRFDELFPHEADLAYMYQPTGRSALSPILMILVVVFQFMCHLPDRAAAEAVVSRIDWKYALHLPLEYPGFHFTDLSAFRRRLLEHGAEQKLFELILKKFQDLGYIKPRGKMRTDSTHVLGLVEALSRLELVTESIRVALNTLIECAPEWVQVTLPPVLLEKFSQRRSEYRMSEEEVKQAFVQAGQDGFWFLAQIDRGPAGLSQLNPVEVLRTVLEQQFPAGQDGPPSEKRPGGNQVIESPHEPEVRHGVKRTLKWQGYKVQVTETCDEDQPHLIVDIHPTQACTFDGPELSDIHAVLKEQGMLPGTHWADQAYISGKRIEQSAQLGIELVGPPPQDTRAPEGFRQSDFHVDESDRHVTCPAGQISSVWSEQKEPDAPAPTIKVRFCGRTCQQCEFFGQCTSSPQGRSLELNPYRKIMAQRREEAQTPEYKEKLHRRAGIEATISELTRRYGMRQARYRGIAKLRLQGFFTGVAVNLCRMGQWWAQTYQNEGLVMIPA